MKTRQLALAAAAVGAATLTFTVCGTASALTASTTTAQAHSSPRYMASPNTPYGYSVARHVVSGSQAARMTALRKYWTPQRLRDAIPLTPNTPRSTTSSSAMTPKVTAGARDSLVSLASPAAPATSNSRLPQVGAGRAAPARSITSGGRMSASQAAALTTPATQGKVFFHNPADGNDYVCSAGTINNPAKDMVFTAGHCINNGAGTWMDEWVYVPAYYYGQTPYGIYEANVMTSFNAWILGGDLNYDIGVVNVGTYLGTLLVNYTGGNGLTYDANDSDSYAPTVTIWGYPAAPPYDGEQAYYCPNVSTGVIQTIVTLVPLYVVTQLAAPCAMTGGASGGPWLVNYNASTGLGSEDALTSTDVPSAPGYIASPYFGSDIPQIYAVTKNS